MVKNNRNHIFFPIISLVIGYIIVGLFMIRYLSYSFLQSDVLGYWQDSLTWRTPFHSFHVPGFPLSIALLRGITLNFLSPIMTMWIINLSAFVISIFFVYKIFDSIGVGENIKIIATFLFGLWPLVGLTYTVVPLADLPVICLFLIGIYYLQRLKFLPAGIFFGLALITHKAIWIFVLLTIIFDFVKRREYLSKRNIVLVFVTILPIALLWFFGSSYHHSFTWLISSNLNVEIASRGNFPILDGILGTFLSGGVKGIIKGLILLAFLVITVISLIANLKLVSDIRYIGISISLGVLALFVVLNQNEIWAAVRFSRLLIIPLVIGCPKFINDWITQKRHMALVSLILVAFFISQFGYAWYIAKVFYA